ncbi:peptidase, S54 (rhomboid) family protein [Crocosphaera chwakensis CCY0110]|uniref:Peptidase, S54 (Rhomboid) family protein n=1 Tax=Crocosphaera chwakensis CCY0110 TaxID=391612 RepID=A3INJ1_9CHRO|nr:peptidase, S54 (rhomboid) family protein [Crocosphaera chwakensis CCY0110]
MVPLNDNNPTQRTAYVTYGLIIVNILVFFKEISLNSEELSQFFQYYAIVPKQLTAGFSGVDFYHPIPEWMT